MAAHLYGRLPVVTQPSEHPPLGRGPSPRKTPISLASQMGLLGLLGATRAENPSAQRSRGTFVNPDLLGSQWLARHTVGGPPARVRGRYQADSGVVTGALQEVGQQLVRGALLQPPLPGILPDELQRVQAALHEAKPEVPESSHQRAADIL